MKPLHCVQTWRLWLLLVTCTAMVACGDPSAGSAQPAEVGAVDAGPETLADGLAEVLGPGDSVGDTSEGDTGSVGPSPDVGDPLPPGGPVDPACMDGAYSEALPSPNAPLDTLKASYTAAAVESFIMDVLGARYPLGAHIVEQALTHTQMGNCVAYFAYDTSTAEKVIGTLSTVVHECGHFLDIGLGGWSDDVYVITDALTFQCSGGDKFEYGGNTFPRSALMSDSFASLRSTCSEGQWNGCDPYADTYLVGDSGDQGFNTLMEEAVQYVNSLATSYAFADQSLWTTSAKDGILTFLWYIERYLYLARTEYPDTHAFILGDACFRELILTTWGRAWLYLETTAPLTNLGMEAEVIEALVLDPTLLAEIDAVRVAHGCN